MKEKLTGLVYSRARRKISKGKIGGLSVIVSGLVAAVAGWLEAKHGVIIPPAAEAALLAWILGSLGS